MTARTRYEALRTYREDFLSKALEGTKLTLPYLIKDDDDTSTHKNLKTPWQSVGAKGVVTLASKLMLALMPPQGSFFKLQLDETELTKQNMDPAISSEIDLSFAKIEKKMMQKIAASYDRVAVHQAMKHLIVTGNVLIFMDKEKLKVYPLNRYVLERDGVGNITEIVTKERVSKQLVAEKFPQLKGDLNPPGNPDINTYPNQCEIYTHIVREGKQYKWYQEVYDKPIPGTKGQASVDTNPWIALRFNVCDDEAYGRGRVEEFLGDLKSLEALSQALVEGSAAAAKVVFTVSPSSSTKPATLAQAGNGAIVQGRPEDIGVVQVGKTADFRTAYEMAMGLEKRLADAFLVMQVRNSERTTAEEVRLTQDELEKQLGGLFSLLTVDFLVPYLNRKLSQAQKQNDIPKLPKGLVNPTIIAGVNAIGRGNDREALTMFMQTIAQTMGPEAIQKYINPDEVVKRLAASQGIDVLNLVKSKENLQAEMQQQQQQAQQLEMTKQASQLQRNQMEQQNASNQIPNTPGAGQPGGPPPTPDYPA